MSTDLLLFSILLLHTQASELPNLIFFLQDDIGYNDVGFNSGQPSTSPNATAEITALARSGVILESHFTHWHCSPSRRSLLTGRFPVHHGEFLSDIYTDDIDLRWEWISDKLKTQGYSNYYFGKGHTGFKSMGHLPYAHGFDQSLLYLTGSGSYETLPRFVNNHPVEPQPDPEYSTDLFGRLALEALEAHDTRSPIFILLSWQATHTPYDLPPSPPLPSRTCDATVEDRKGRCADAIGTMLEACDVWVGRIVATLKRRGIYENTVIVYAGDNGGLDDYKVPIGGNNYPLRGEKHTNWQGGIKTAAFVSGGLVPPLLRGTTSPVNIHIADWYATLVRLAGGDPTDDPPVPPLPVDGNTEDGVDIYQGNLSYPPVDGVDLWPILMSATTNRSAAHASLVIAREVLIMGRYKLITAQPNPAIMSVVNLENGWRNPNGTWSETAPTYDHNNNTNNNNNNSNPLLPPLLSSLSSSSSPSYSSFSFSDANASEYVSCNAFHNTTAPLRPCLFDLSADPREAVNIAAAHPDLVETMWAELNRSELTAFTSRSPPSLVGACNATCANETWDVWGGGPGPLCGVVGCE